MRKILEWLGLVNRPGVLERLVRTVPEFREIARRDHFQALVAAALGLRAAGCEHLVDPHVTPDELAALARAGAVRDLEHAQRIAGAIRNPQALRDEIDGGQASCDEWAEASCREAAGLLEREWSRGGVRR